MKPADHPDFFRMPPPKGRSRESSIRLDGQGRFSHDGEPVQHLAMNRAFASWIARHPDDGRFILTNGYDWTYFTVEDAPYFVESVREGSGGLVLALFDGSEEPLDPGALRVDEDGSFRVSVKGGGFEARFLRQAQLALGAHLIEEPDGAVALEIGGVRSRLSL